MLQCARKMEAKYDHTSLISEAMRIRLVEAQSHYFINMGSTAICVGMIKFGFTKL